MSDTHPEEQPEYAIKDEDGNIKLVTEKPENLQFREEEKSSLSPQNSVELSDGKKLAVLVSGPGQWDEGPIPSDTTATIWAGMYDDSGIAPVGIGSVDLDITVTRPDGTEENLSATTDGNGSASATYDLSQSERGDGTYNVTVADQDGHSTSTTFDAGVLTVTLTSNFSEYNFTGEEAEFAFVVTDGASGVSGVSLTLRAKSGGDKIKETTKTTDTDGFATIAFTPSSAGNYQIEAELNGDVKENGFINVVDMYVNSTSGLEEALVGETNTYGGYLISKDGHVTNTDLVLKFYTDRQQSDLFKESSVTTDDGGFFTVDYDIPEGFSESALYVVAETTDEQQIPVNTYNIDVNEPRRGDGGGGGGSTVSLNGVVDSRYSPGEQVTVDIEATDDGDPIANQSIDVFLRFDFSGPPIYSTTVTTDDGGTASTSFQLPSNAPDGFNLDGVVAMEYNSDTYTSSIYSDIRQYNISFQGPNPVAPGGSGTYSLTVTDGETGDPVEGVPLQFGTVYSHKSGSFGTGGLESGSDGTDSTTVQIPSDSRRFTLAPYVHRYSSSYSAKYTAIDHPGTLSKQDGETLDVGQTTNFSFSVPDDVTVHGLLFGETDYTANKSFATSFQGPGTVSLNIPEVFPEDDYARFTALAIDDQGTIYQDSQSYVVDTGSIYLDAKGEKNISSGGEGTISMYAQQVDQITISKLWTDWAVSSSNTDGGTVTDNIADSGEVTFSYDSIQGDVSSGFNVSIPSDYIGGTYEVEITASNTDGASVTKTATLTIS